MAGFNLTAKFGVDATGVKTGVADAANAVDKGSREMEKSGARSGRGISTSMGDIRFNAKKTKFAIINLAQSIASGGDVVGSLGMGLTGLAKSAKGALAIGVGVGIGGAALTAFLDMRKAAKALNKELKDLSEDGMSLSGQSAENLSSHIVALNDKLKESKKSAVGGLREAWEIVNGAFGGGEQKEREKDEREAVKDREKATDSLIGKLKQQLEIEQKILTGDKRGAEMAALQLKQQEQLTALAAHLGSTPGFQNIRKATVAAQQVEMKQLIKKQAEERGAEERKAFQDQMKRSETAADQIRERTQQRNFGRATRQQQNKALQDAIKEDQGRMAGAPIGERAELELDINEKQGQLRDRAMAREAMSPSERRAFDSSERKRLRAERHYDTVARNRTKTAGANKSAFDDFFHNKEPLPPMGDNVINGRARPRDFHALVPTPPITLKGFTNADVVKAVDRVDATLKNLGHLTMLP